MFLSLSFQDKRNIHNHVTLELPLVGKKLELGMLYDCQNDSFSERPWTQRKIRTAQQSTFQTETKIVITANNSCDKEPKSARVDLSAKIIFSKESLNMKRLSFQKNERPEATHVITGILYGTEACFRFEKGIEDNNLVDVSRQLHDIVTDILSFSRLGEKSFKVDENDQEILKTVKCMYENKKISYKEAIGIFHDVIYERKEQKPLTACLEPVSDIFSEHAISSTPHVSREIEKNIAEFGSRQTINDVVNTNVPSLPQEHTEHHTARTSSKSQASSHIQGEVEHVKQNLSKARQTFQTHVDAKQDEGQKFGAEQTASERACTSNQRVSNEHVKQDPLMDNPSSSSHYGPNPGRLINTDSPSSSSPACSTSDKKSMPPNSGCMETGYESTKATTDVNAKQNPSLEYSSSPSDIHSQQSERSSDLLPASQVMDKEQPPSYSSVARENREKSGSPQDSVSKRQNLLDDMDYTQPGTGHAKTDLKGIKHGKTEHNPPAFFTETLSVDVDLKPTVASSLTTEEAGDMKSGSSMQIKHGYANKESKTITHGNTKHNPSRGYPDSSHIPQKQRERFSSTRYFTSDVQKELDRLHDLAKKCEALRASMVDTRFPQFEKRIKTCKSYLNTYINTMKRNLRAEKSTKSTYNQSQTLNVLMKTLENKNHPFHYLHLQGWINLLENEFKIFKEHTDSLRWMETISRKDLPRWQNTKNIHNLVCFTFSIDVDSDQYLDDLNSEVHDFSSHGGNKSKTSESYELPGRWCQQAAKLDAFTKNAERFRRFAAENSELEGSKFVLVNCVNDNDGFEFGSIVLWHRNQRNIVPQTHFEPVDALNKPSVCNIQHDAITILIRTDSSDPQMYNIKYKENCINGKIKDPVKSHEKQMHIINLIPGMSYQFSISLSSETGLCSPWSPLTDPVSTRYLGPPWNVMIKRMTKKYISLAWSKPINVRPQLHITKYMLKIVPIDAQGVHDHIIYRTDPPVCCYNITDLNPEIAYEISVSAGVGNGEYSAYSEPVKVPSNRGCYPWPTTTTTIPKQTRSRTQTLLAPEKVAFIEKGCEYITLTFDPKTRGIDSEGLVVMYKEKEAKNHEWIEHYHYFTHKGHTITIENLSLNTEYEFLVHSCLRRREANLVPLSLSCTTLASSPPLSLRKLNATDTTVTLSWDRPTLVANALTIQKYKIRYSPLDKKQQTKEVKTENYSCSLTIKSLDPYTLYSILVCPIFENNVEGAFSTPTEMAPASGVARSFIRSIRIVSAQDTSLPIYRIPLQKSEVGGHESYKFQEKFGKSQNHKVIILVGEEGSGKSTLIDLVLNYVLQVNWEDDFRFKMTNVHPKYVGQVHEHVSTKNITSYTVFPPKGSNTSCIFTIIDTPGFGRLGRSDTLSNMITDFISHSRSHNVDHFDAIGLVAPAAQARLTASQRLFFDSISRLFGTEYSKMRDNLMLLLTFADGERPPVIDAIKAANIPYRDQNIFKFNNSALFAEKTKDPEQDQLQKCMWEIGYRSMERFMTALHSA